MTDKKNRIEWIDYLKAFACILVVLGHLLQSFQKSNIDNNQNITSFIIWFIYLFHMRINFRKFIIEELPGFFQTP